MRLAKTPRTQLPDYTQLSKNNPFVVFDSFPSQAYAFPKTRLTAGFLTASPDGIPEFTLRFGLDLVTVTDGDAEAILLGILAGTVVAVVSRSAERLRPDAGKHVRFAAGVVVVLETPTAKLSGKEKK